MEKQNKARTPRINRFQLPPGTLIADKFEILSRLGAGWEGEVYLVMEKATGIERTAKLFYPHRNLRDKAVKFYACKLHRLRYCPIIIQYHTQETMIYRGIPVSVLVSEYVEGELLSRFLRRQKGGRLTAFQAVHLLHALAEGIECVHQQGDYHGDLHPDNIIVERFGLGFELKLLDMFHWGPPSAQNTRADVCDLIRIFYDALGGKSFYKKHPPEIKAICCGLKRSLITQKFRTAAQLRAHLEQLSWE